MLFHLFRKNHYLDFVKRYKYGAILALEHIFDFFSPIALISPLFWAFIANIIWHISTRELTQIKRKRSRERVKAVRLPASQLLLAWTNKILVAISRISEFSLQVIHFSYHTDMWLCQFIWWKWSSSSSSRQNGCEKRSKENGSSIWYVCNVTCSMIFTVCVVFTPQENFSSLFLAQIQIDVQFTIIVVFVSHYAIQE